MLGLDGMVRAWFVPPAAQGVFLAAWRIAALAQPVCALSFVTDGIHWGTADYRYLRNGMIMATGLGILALLEIDREASGAFTSVWLVTAGWLGIRTAFGLVRIWPGIGRSPLRTA
jgi:MATE family multidrug resistance protein